MTILDFSICRRKKKLAVVERLFWQLGTCVSGRCREVVVVERSPLWRGDRRREVAVLERWPL